NPQAMNAAMFGMIMPDKNVPNFCTATRTLFALLTGTSAFTAISPSGPRGRPPPPPSPHRPRRDRSPATPIVRLLRLPVQDHPDRSTSTDRGGAGPMRVVRFHAPRDLRGEGGTPPSA